MGRFDISEVHSVFNTSLLTVKKDMSHFTFNCSGIHTFIQVKVLNTSFTTVNFLNVFSFIVGNLCKTKKQNKP